MHLFPELVTLALAVASTAAGSALPRAAPFDHLKSKGQSGARNGLQVDLGYSIYKGFLNHSSGLNQWNGVRFAAPPIGSLRWQAPQVPEVDRSQVIDASEFGAQCPQSSGSGSYLNSPPEGSEDCLFLNVYAPPDARNLPVMIWIHGGGYGLGNGQPSLAPIIIANNNSFVGVSIQYRLGAFGFLSSDEVFRNGAVNTGILDQYFAFQWVHSYIEQFGGNASQVTIAGESAGAGSVMLHAMAYGGSQGETLFSNLFAASPYLPMQYGYKDWVPSQAYYAFATHAGCLSNTTYGSSATTIFQCLVAQDTAILQNASSIVSASGVSGTWGFLPVTDGVFVQNAPSQQFLLKQVNGRNLLVGNNAEEGTIFVPQSIDTENDLVSWLRLTFPLFSNDDIAKILLYYPNGDGADTSGINFATAGYTEANAINESATDYGQQQRANNIYAETTFVCPSYWMAEAYSENGRTSYKYQYSVLPALHGQDAYSYFSLARAYQGAEFGRAFMTIIGRFVTTNNPSISAAIANGLSSTAVDAVNPASQWPPFSIYAPYQIDLNQTGGVEVTLNGSEALSVPGLGSVEVYVGPGLRNKFTLSNAYTLEGGRGFRCDFWRSIAWIVPE